MAEKDVKKNLKEKNNDSESFLTLKGVNSSVASTTCDDQSIMFLTNADIDSGQFSHENEVCSVCIKTEYFRAATHFCKTCQPCGKYLCGTCLKAHTNFSNHHKVLSLSVNKKSKRISDRQIKNIKKGDYSDYTKSWLDEKCETARSRSDSLYSTIKESDQTTILSDSSRTRVENSLASRTMTSSTIATSDGTEIIGSDNQSFTISNLQLFDRDSEGIDSLYGHRKDLVTSENRGLHRDINTGLLHLAPITLPDKSTLRQNILRERSYALQARSMQNLNSKQYEDSQEENWTSGNEHGNSDAKTEVSDDQDVTIPKLRLPPARSMQNIYFRQSVDTPNQNRCRSEGRGSDASYTDLRYDQEENEYAQIYDGDGGSSYYRFKIKNKKKCIVM